MKKVWVIMADREPIAVAPSGKVADKILANTNYRTHALMFSISDGTWPAQRVVFCCALRRTPRWNCTKPGVCAVAWRYTDIFSSGSEYRRFINGRNQGGSQGVAATRTGAIRKLKKIAARQNIGEYHIHDDTSDR